MSNQHWPAITGWWVGLNNIPWISQRAHASCSVLCRPLGATCPGQRLVLPHRCLRIKGKNDGIKNILQQHPKALAICHDSQFVIELVHRIAKILALLEKKVQMPGWRCTTCGFFRHLKPILSRRLSAAAKSLPNSKACFCLSLSVKVLRHLEPTYCNDLFRECLL